MWLGGPWAHPFRNALLATHTRALGMSEWSENRSAGPRHGVEGEDHGRCRGNATVRAVRLCGEICEDEEEKWSCDVSRRGTEMTADDLRDSVSPNMSLSQSKGTISLNHSSCSLEGVFRAAGLRRKTLYGDTRWGELARDGGMGMGSDRLGI